MALSRSLRDRAELPLTEAALCAWFGQAGAGDSLTYHRGMLALDISPDGPLSRQARTELMRVANRALRLSEQGCVHLFQRKHGQGDYEYLLVAGRRHESAGEHRGPAEQSVLRATS